MLSDKGALISEERVKNLTDAQWIFHYAEICHKNKKEGKERSDVINIILDRIEMMICNGSIFSRTDLKYEKIKEVIDKIRNRHEENIDTVDDCMHYRFNDSLHSNRATEFERCRE